MKGLVVSGGGSKGAFAAGVVCANPKLYKKFYGASTGALVIVLAAAGKYKLLKQMYCNIDNNDVFDSNPFNKKGELSKWKAFVRILKRQNTIGTTRKLLSKIRDSYTEEDHKHLGDKEIVVTVTNMTLRTVEYKSSNDYSWEDFTFWVWVSTLAYPYAETVFVDGCEYGDGGFSVNLPVVKASEECDELDVIVLSPEEDEENFENVSIIKGITSIVDLLLDTSMQNNIIAGENLESSVKINWVFTPFALTELPMFFDKNAMNRWYNLGKKEIL